MLKQTELTYMYSLERFGIKPGLAVMEQMMEALGHPERKFKSIHVTGTNGKGSTCAMMESILRTAGYTTALYTSPHLYVFNERIRVGGVSISDEALRPLISELRSCIEEKNIQPTFFEFTTALAYLYFARCEVDIAVIEVGMGGLYDATNVITPLLSVITNVGLDHTEYLGPTTAHIAREKAGIIKEGVPVITAEKDTAILAIFDGVADEKHTEVLRVREVVRTRVLSSTLQGQEIQIEGETPYTVHLPLLGVHQVTNMATAMLAMKELSLQGFSLSEESIISGIGNTVWEGRLQIISQDPLIIVDGAHNQDGARALASFLSTVSRHDILIFAAKKGKDISDMEELVIPLFTEVIVTEGSFMPEDAEVLAEKIRSIHSAVYVEKNTAAAIGNAQTRVPKGGTIVITGSLYMIADALTYFKTV